MLNLINLHGLSCRQCNFFVAFHSTHIVNMHQLIFFSVCVDRLTFTRVIKKKSTEEFSCIPYLISLLNCLIYTWYGLPIVSYKWENFPLVTINGLGILLEISFIVIYFWFATAKTKATFVFHDHHDRKVFVGSVGLVACVAMYGSPLVVMKQVIETKSVEFMPFYLSFFSFMASSLWMAYGLLGHDLFLASPNIVATPLGLLQLVLYCKYRKSGVTEEPNIWDIEQNTEKSKQLQLVTNNDTNLIAVEAL
ncbi:hypothetical protein Ddye_013943 [Dipteronia dyeriana]|uniref:Bidirectional sugar transporter SWEET n=1 Tax=Dipteronia dyeriana TaxID=168575 RepID=A0AAE0CK39_9ROSI|nr:hypothetical protein Ddye_013943 [Dipteronia dyeriana]